MEYINVNKLKNMFVAGAEKVSDNFEYINKLNVFPVPDGDTGSNMKITCINANSTIESVEFKDLKTLGNTYSRALLMNARGNSGVIFSQIIKGFVSAFPENQTELDISTLIKSFELATKRGYVSLVNPIEGTILTVIRMISESLNANIGKFKTIEELFKFVVEQGKIALDKTPDFLINLKQANVVDSGGYALCCYLEGMYECLLDKKEASTSIKKPINNNINIMPNFIDNNEGFGYCCEFILKIGAKVVSEQSAKRSFSKDELTNKLKKIGDSLVLVHDDDIVKVHVHSINPYKVLQIGAEYGEFSKVKIENMTFQFLDNNPGLTLDGVKSKKAKSNNATDNNLSDTTQIISTISTNELSELFKKDLSGINMIDTETNLNPSIQNFLDALKKVKSKKIILLVHDSNMMLSAKEAIKFLSKNIKVHLICTNDVGLNYLLCLSYSIEQTYEQTIKKMNSIMKKVRVGKISKSIKKIKFNDVPINTNDFFSIYDKKIKYANKNQMNVLNNLIDLMSKQFKKSLPKQVYIFYGNEFLIENNEEIKKYIKEKLLVDPEFIFTNESIYSYHVIMVN